MPSSGTPCAKVRTVGHGRHRHFAARQSQGSMTACQKKSDGCIFLASLSRERRHQDLHQPGHGANDETNLGHVQLQPLCGLGRGSYDATGTSEGSSRKHLAAWPEKTLQFSGIGQQGMTLCDRLGQSAASSHMIAPRVRHRHLSPACDLSRLHWFFGQADFFLPLTLHKTCFASHSNSRADAYPQLALPISYIALACLPQPGLHHA